MLFRFAVAIGDDEYLVDLVLLPILPQNIILGMDWFTRHGAIIDCGRRIVTISSDGRVVCRFRGHTPEEDGRVIIVMQAAKLLRQGGVGFLFYLQDQPSDPVPISDIPVVRAFSDVFPDEIPSLPSKQFIEFTIDLEPGTAPISKAPYRMAPVEMQ